MVDVFYVSFIFLPAFTINLTDLIISFHQL